MTDNELLFAISDMMDKKRKPVKDEMRKMKSEMKSEIGKIKLYQENEIMPRLQNIESCYTDTFKRYQSGVEQLDAIQMDVDVIKDVVCEHSDKFQKIS